MKSKTVKCGKNVNFADCELTILRSAVDLAQEKIGKRVAGTEEISEIIKILEDFLKKKNLICYGGTAINNILPKEDQFYDKESEIPDYDFFSPNAMHDAKELADIYFDKGYEEVEAKAGQHHGTFKVYVNFIPIADITSIPKELFEALKPDSIRVAGILYCAPNFLRMSMFLELSRPAGDTDRWEKVLKRLSLLNKHHPLTSKQCSTVDFQRELSDKDHNDEIYENVKNTLVNQGVVFFGGYAISLYSQYMPRDLQKQLKSIPDFDVLSTDPETTAQIVKERLKDIDIKDVKIVKQASVGEVVPECYEIKVGKDTIAFIYKPVGCHSYNNITIHGEKIKIATIDTMLSFYLAFLYANKPYFDTDRIICMSKFLFDVQQKNRLEQKGLLRRFSITCYGHQETVEEMRAEKAKKYKELREKRGTREFDEYFLSYKPSLGVKKPKTYRERSQIKKKTRKARKSKKGYFNF